MHNKILLFDVDGVLIDTMDVWDRSANDYLYERFHIVSPDWLDGNCTTLSLPEAGEYIKSEYPSLPITAQQLAKEIPEFIGKKYVKAPGCKGMADTIKALYEKGYLMYLATASNQNLVKQTLDNLGVWQYFQGIYTCDDIGWGKRYQEYYLDVIARLQCQPKDLVMIEDSLHSMKSAKAAGLYVVGVYEKHSENNINEIKKVCDWYVNELPELIDVIERLV